MKVVNQAAIVNPEWSLVIEKFAFNSFDSSMSCEAGKVIEQVDFLAALVFLIIWLLIAPQFVLIRAGREFIIDFIGMLSKVALLFIIKYVVQYSEFYALVCGAFVIVF